MFAYLSTKFSMTLPHPTGKIFITKGKTTLIW